MSTERRITFLLVVFLLVFLVAFYILVRGMSRDTDVSQKMPAESSDVAEEEATETEDVGTFSFSGVVSSVEGNMLSIRETSSRTITIPGSEFEEAQTRDVQNELTVSLGESTLFEGIRREEIAQGMEVTVVAREVSADPLVYEAERVTTASQEESTKEGGL